jgi:hypothetical protein
MRYQIPGNIILCPIDRTHIIDIAVDDILELQGFPGARYVWTEQDREFVENNPDDDIYLQLERSEGIFTITGIFLMSTFEQ